MWDKVEPHDLLQWSILPGVVSDQPSHLPVRPVFHFLMIPLLYRISEDCDQTVHMDRMISMKFHLKLLLYHPTQNKTLLSTLPKIRPYLSPSSK